MKTSPKRSFAPATVSPSYLEHVDRIHGLRSLPELVRESRAVTGQLLQDLNGPNAQGHHEQLVAAWEATRLDFRRRGLLSLCAWPAFDYAPLPGDESHALFVFALPFVVTVSPAQAAQGSFRVDYGLENVEQMTATVGMCGAVAAAEGVRAFDRLYTREDLLTAGPQRLAEALVAAELGRDEPDAPPSSGANFDPENSCFRTLTLYLPCAVPVSAREMAVGILKRVDWPDAVMSGLLQDALRAQGLDVESVQSFPPAPLRQAVLRVGGPDKAELLANIRHFMSEGEADEGFELLVHTDGTGSFELTARAVGTTNLLEVMPPLRAIEPEDAFVEFIGELAVEAGFQAVSRTSHVGPPASSALH